jgi:hypothetical protein
VIVIAEMLFQSDKVSLLQTLVTEKGTARWLQVVYNRLCKFIRA